VTIAIVLALATLGCTAKDRNDPISVACHWRYCANLRQWKQEFILWQNYSKLMGFKEQKIQSNLTPPPPRANLHYGDYRSRLVHFEPQINYIKN
jgi:hypothetical protein